MNKSIILLLAFTAVFASMMTLQQHYDSVRGFMEGLEIKYDQAIIDRSNSIRWSDVVRKSITLFANSNVDSHKQAYKLLALTLRTIRVQLQKAANINDFSYFLRRVESHMKDTLNYPQSIEGGKIVFMNVDITKEIKHAVKTLSEQDYYTASKSVGQAIRRLYLATEPASSQEFVNELNNIPKLWTAGSYAEFENMSLEQFAKQKLGGKLKKTSFNATRPTTPLLGDPQASWNWSAQNPTCIHPIRNQMHCGSCWAFAGSEVLSDRFCIASNASINTVLSPQYLVTCDTQDYGCNGGYLDMEWSFIEQNGIVDDTCAPYVSGDGKTFPSCFDYQTCADGTKIPRKYYAILGSSQGLIDINAMKMDIQTNGPVETGFNVFADFKQYTSGIYHHVSGDFLGGHAVKVIGWGVDSGVNYWICANSWSEKWGEQGFFRIQQGDSGIDDEFVAGLPDLQRQ